MTAAQLEILGAVAGEPSRWWTAMEVVAALGRGTGPGIGCAMKGLVKRGLFCYRPMSRKAGRWQATYQITEAGRCCLDLELSQRRSAS